MVTLAGAITLLLVVGVYLSLVRSKNRELMDRLTVWLIFSVVLALTPLTFNAAVIFIAGRNLTFADILAHGELLIVCVAVGADAVGRMIGSGPHKKTLKILAAGGCILLIILSSLLFSVIAVSPGTYDAERVTSSSSFLFLMTIIAGGSCVLLAESGVKE